MLTHTNMLPFEHDAEGGSAGVQKLQDDGCIDCDKHFQGERHLHLTQSAGDRQ